MHVWVSLWIATEQMYGSGSGAGASTGPGPGPAAMNDQRLPSQMAKHWPPV